MRGTFAHQSGNLLPLGGQRVCVPFVAALDPAKQGVAKAPWLDLGGEISLEIGYFAP
jgi:hypothetical protein